jgi:hypothetical protein
MGRGERLDLWQMPRGRYQVTLTATDRDGQTGSASIAVLVGYSMQYLPVALR